MVRADCKDLRENGHTDSGVYQIYPNDNDPRPLSVYCDMTTMGGGWTVIQKRVDGSLSFNKDWETYKIGFGSPEQNVWIGNDVIHQLTKGNNSSLYVSITLQDGTGLYELYEKFAISNETENYKLFLAGPARGTLGDSMLTTAYSNFRLSGMYFTTYDRDNDRYSDGNCATKHKGGWWFNGCYNAFLNGLWSTTDWVWPWTPKITDGTSVKGTVMM
ncbi:fibroleukin-like, partial [Saccostrea cucullata]|uniref:fibroleukin-like n=1 Tax=Saccostrea cuccullata TaxID=36930 RepID=UPI002ED48023